MQFTRRAALTLLAGALAVGTITPATAEDGFSVLVATNEPYGSYHIKALVDDVESKGGRIALVSPDLDHKRDDGVEVVTLDQADDWGADLLVVNGATEWPVQVATELDELDIVASSLAYLRPEAEPGADAIRDRIVGATAQTPKEAEVFASNMGLDLADIEIVGNAQLDGLAPYQPERGTVLIATSVTYPSETGGAAPGTQLLLDTAAALEAEGYKIRVGLHPRENPELWNKYEIATEGTTAASTTAEVVVGIPGSVFPQVAAVGAPLVGIFDPALNVPEYIADLAARATTVEEAVAAVKAGWRPDAATLQSSIGPVGGSADRLWAYWMNAVAPQEQPSPKPTPSESEQPTPKPEPTPTTTAKPTKPGMPRTGVTTLAA